MRCRTKILILFLTLILTFSMFALSVFALEDGQLFTFKDEYTFDELQFLYGTGGDSTRLVHLSNHPFTDFSDDDYFKAFYYNVDIFDSTFMIGMISSTVVDGSDYTLFVLIDGVYYTTTSSDGSRTYALSGETVKFDHDLILEFDSSYTCKLVDSVFNSYFPVYVEPVTFISAATSGITHVIGWIGTVISSLILENGSLRPLLILFAVPVSISAIFFGVRAVKNVIWGS